MERRRSSRGNALPSWIRQRSLPASTAVGIRRKVVEDLCEASGARMGMYHGVGVLQGALHFVGVEVVGPPARLARMPDMDGRPVAEFMNLRSETLTAFNAFERYDVVDVEDRPIYRLVWQPVGWVGCVAMSAVVGGTLVGWVGGFLLDEQGCFNDDVLARLRPRIDAYVNALDVAHRMEGQSSADRAVLLFAPNGDLAYSCDRGRGWLCDDDLAKQLRDEVLAVSEGGEARPFWARGAIVRLTTVAGEVGTLYCAELAAAAPWEAAPVGYLSLKKRRIAEAAALGATVHEIARSMDVKGETVRKHLKGIYESLGVSSRVELAAKVREVTEKCVLPS